MPLVSFSSVFVQDMRRALSSKLFFISGVMIAALMYWMSFMWPSDDVLNSFKWAFTGNAAEKVVICIIPGMTYAYSYIADYNSRAVRFWCIRAGVARYSLSKFISAALTGMLTYMLGAAILAALMMMSKPLNLNYIGWEDGYTSILISETGASTFASVLYLCCYVFHYALSAALVSGIAFCASTITLNVFVAIMAPLILDLFYSRACSLTTHIPTWIGEVGLMQSIHDMGSPVSTMLTKIAAVAGILAVFCAISCFFIRRRFLNE